METWTRTWKHGQGYGNIDEDMATDKDMETWMRTSKLGQRHDDIVEDMIT